MEIHVGKAFVDVYTKEETKMRKIIYEALKKAAIEKKNTDLTGKGVELLTKDNLTAWLTAGESYTSIAKNHTGVSDKVIAKYAAMYGLAAQAPQAAQKEVYEADDQMKELVATYSITDILNVIAEILGVTTDKSNPTESRAPNHKSRFFPFKRMKKLPA